MKFTLNDLKHTYGSVWSIHDEDPECGCGCTSNPFSLDPGASLIRVTVNRSRSRADPHLSHGSSLFASPSCILQLMARNGVEKSKQKAKTGCTFYPWAQVSILSLVSAILEDPRAPSSRGKPLLFSWPRCVQPLSRVLYPQFPPLAWEPSSLMYRMSLNILWVLKCHSILKDLVNPSSDWWTPWETSRVSPFCRLHCIILYFF